MGKVYTEEKIKELNEEEVEKLFNNYKARWFVLPYFAAFRYNIGNNSKI